jgi:hypothetical protein
MVLRAFGAFLVIYSPNKSMYSVSLDPMLFFVLSFQVMIFVFGVRNDAGSPSHQEKGD